MTVVQIVARRENAPKNFPRKTQVHAPTLPKFCDAAYWNELAAKHLPRYDLPAWDVPCSPEAIERWLDRLDLSERDYLRTSGLKRLEEFMKLNPRWPLRAWIGTVLELKEEEGRKP